VHKGREQEIRVEQPVGQRTCMNLHEGWECMIDIGCVKHVELISAPVAISIDLAEGFKVSGKQSYDSMSSSMLSM
jgi:hypothetical protein